MNTYSFQDIKVGLTESFTVVVKEEMLSQFYAITGDNNPLHMDEDFAHEVGHPGRVVYGMLTSAFLSTLAGVYLPGRYSLIHSVETKLKNPVYIGDELTITGKVKELHESVETMEIDVTITNQNQKKVLKGTMNIGFLHER
ncbi:MAG: MaoC family dehydratase [Pseudobutyrivibrio sp.]|nr:MaoC family dehydratase [Pseudobutyrivibrio sp.]